MLSPPGSSEDLFDDSCWDGVLALVDDPGVGNAACRPADPDPTVIYETEAEDLEVGYDEAALLCGIDLAEIQAIDELRTPTEIPWPSRLARNSTEIIRPDTNGRQIPVSRTFVVEDSRPAVTLAEQALAQVGGQPANGIGTECRSSFRMDLSDPSQYRRESTRLCRPSRVLPRRARLETLGD